MTTTFTFSYQALTTELVRLLSSIFTIEKAEKLAHIFVEAEFDGIKTHGLKRFPRFIEEIRKGWIKIDNDAIPTLKNGNWLIMDGQAGPGPLGALTACNTAVDLAKQHGFSLLALKNTNHWLRAGHYAKLATQQNCILLCWTNTIPNLIAHNEELRSPFANIGNNPLAIGIPNHNTPFIFDSAMSQFSYGKLQEYLENGVQLPVAGGYHEGLPSQDPKIIFDQLSASAIGWWKGTGLSIALDLLAALLSGGQSVVEIGKKDGEQNVSQIFICANPEAVWGKTYKKRIMELIQQLEKHSVRWPGKSMAETRRQNENRGVEVADETWQAVLATL